MFSNEEDLTPAERAALAALPRELAAGDLLEERTIRALRREGHFGASRSVGARRINNAWRMVAALALFAGGVATGRYLLAPAPDRSATVTPVDRPLNGNRSTPPAPARSSERTVAVEMWL